MPRTIVSEYERANIALYGKGVFTTVSVCDSELFLWDKHWSRLTRNAANLGIDVSEHGEQSVRDAVSEAIKRNRLANGRVRITFLDESPSELWSVGGESTTSLSILAGERRTLPPGFRLTTSFHRINTTSPLAGVKSCNYLEPLMSFQEAKDRGFDEALRLNERGEAVSACMANLFWLTGTRLFTPSLKTGCLAGTTREFILENLECEEVETGIDALRAVDEIFLTSAGLGVVQAADFEGRKLYGGDHPIMRILPF